MSDRDPGFETRQSSSNESYLTLVNLSRSDRGPADWRVALVEPTDVEGHEAGLARALWFAVPLSGALWAMLYGLWRLCAG